MPHRKNDENTGPINRTAGNGQGRDEFEDAVTTEISGVLQRAFGDDPPRRDYSQVEITDIDLSAQPAPAEADLLEPGDILNERFELVELVHTGGMSHVYKAIDLRRHRKDSGPIHVAIKTMRRLNASQRESRMALEREASRAQRLSHPNIINVFDFDEFEGSFYLVMEWLDGESVNALLKRTLGQRLDPAFAWSIIEGAAAAVQHAHMNNIVHADINPSNIFITSTHEIKLLDFGVARDCGDKLDVAESRLAWATQTYASPELLSGTTPVFEDDIFSLGCVAYRLLSGDHPFSGSTSLKARDEAMKIAPIAGLSDDDWQTLRRCLDYSRANRPKSAAVFYREVHRIARGDRAGDSTAIRPARWLLAMTVVALLAGASWWAWSNWPELQSRMATSEPAVTAAASATAGPVEVRLTAAENLLADAARAMDESRYLQPADDNARDHYREVLGLDPENPAALRGLRKISDYFVREAEAALRAGAPARSTAALQLAADTDAGNPAIALVDALVIAEGDRYLAQAQRAASAGDVTLTSELLARAENFAHIDAAALQESRNTLSERVRAIELDRRIAVIDDRIVNGRLWGPDSETAHSLTLDLIATYGQSAQVDAVSERLGARLLSIAAAATAAEDYALAIDYLDAADDLPAVLPEVAMARTSLQAAISAAARKEAAAAAANDPDERIGAVADAQTIIPTQPTSGAARASNELTAGDTAPAAAARREPVETISPAPRRQTLSELGIQRFVPPDYPRSARRRGLSGYVEVGFAVYPDGTTGEFQVLDAVPPGVFDKSARDAVRKWRFEQRENPFEARIVLTFNVDP